MGRNNTSSCESWQCSFGLQSANDNLYTSQDWAGVGRRGPESGRDQMIQLSRNEVKEYI